MCIAISNYETCQFLFSVGPTSVTILNKKDPVSAGKEVDVRCQTVGARPPPTITWWLAGKQVLEGNTLYSIWYKNHHFDIPLILLCTNLVSNCRFGAILIVLQHQTAISRFLHIDLYHQRWTREVNWFVGQEMLDCRTQRLKIPGDLKYIVSYYNISMPNIEILRFVGYSFLQHINAILR